MFSMIKFCITFCFSFLLLSVPLNKKPLFFYLERWARPVTDKVFKNSTIVFWESIEDSKEFGKKIFSNSLPKNGHDQVQTKSSSLAKEDDLDNYTDEEKLMLTRILKGE